MAEDRVFKHVCKFCSKSFPCGRSLGGHMRSHMINDVTSQSDGTKVTKKKLPSLPINNKSDTINEIVGLGYGLRENPRKTWRSLADHSSTEDTSSDILCKDCGRVFQSWKGLFSHMKSHDPFEIEEEQQDSWSSKVVIDSQSDNEETAAAAAVAASYRRRRSKRRTRYMRIAANSSSLSFASNSASETELEQEEVAMCLIMLSMDKGGAVNSVAESSVLASDDASETAMIETAKLELGELKVDAKKTKFTIGIGNSVMESDHSSKGKSSKRKLYVAIEAELDSERNSKFECATCNKTFHSYQALGGHKASHKKIKGCFPGETRISDEPEQSPAKNQVNNETAAAASVSDALAVDTKPKKSAKGHECPICFKVFPSGQALGGHKRSHLVNANATAETKPTKSIPIQEPNPVIRDLLDLNLPAPDEEDSSSVLGFNNNQWWIRSNHEHEALVGLISN